MEGERVCKERVWQDWWNEGGAANAALGLRLHCCVPEAPFHLVGMPAPQPIANVTAILAMLKAGPFHAIQKDLKQITDINLQKDARRLSEVAGVSCDWDWSCGDDCEWRSSANYTTCCSTNQTSMSTALYDANGGAVSAADADSYVGCWCDGKMPLTQAAGAIGVLDDGAFDAIDEARAMCADNTCSDVYKAARTFSWSDFLLGLSFLGGSSSASISQLSEQDYSCGCAMGADATVAGVPQKLYQAYLDNNIAKCEAAGTCTINDLLGMYCAYDECNDIVNNVVDAYNSIDEAWLALMGGQKLSGCSSSSDSSSLVVIIAVVAGVVVLGAVVGVVAMMMKKKSVGPA